jgi:hypothetical protein
MVFHKKFYGPISMLGFALTLFFSVAPAVAQDSMSAADMQVLLSGNTMSGKNEKGQDFHTYFDTSGTMSGLGLRKYRDSGTWEITSEDKYCRQWSKWDKGTLECFHMFNLGNNYYRIKGMKSNFESLFIIQKGDPENIIGN